MMIDDETAEIIKQLEKWHSSQVNQLNKILAHKESVLNIADIEIKPNTDLAKGLRIGVMLSLKLLGELPLSLDPLEEDQDD